MESVFLLRKIGAGEIKATIRAEDAEDVLRLMSQTGNIFMLDVVDVDLQDPNDGSYNVKVRLTGNAPIVARFIDNQGILEARLNNQPPAESGPATDTDD